MEHITSLTSLCVISSVCRSHVSASERFHKHWKDSAFVSDTYINAEDVRRNETAGLTGFELRATGLVFLGYTVDPARNGETNDQNIPDTIKKDRL